ncbi:MAG: hypothetical protein QG596_789 [Actinomycetota bacterium]|jgi:predicted ArsR family transcriptional regulator|nr:hypothetical protein [Actinomycetota bacterium]
MDVTADSNDVLVQPTRARLFASLNDLKRPAETDELASLLDMHPNGIRNHLERMLEAGLVTREPRRHGRGRPRDVWAIDPEAAPGGDPPTAYSELSGWLVEAVERGIANPEEIEKLGRSIGVGLADRQGDGLAPEIRFRNALTAMGFQPSRSHNPDKTVTYCLNNCPYRDTARTGQPLICGLHRGITAGLIESIEPESEMIGFLIREPDRAGCEIRIRGPLAEPVE